MFLGLCVARTYWHQLEETNYSFKDYEAEFFKSYETMGERRWRRELFEANLQDIITHNRGDHSWKKGVNQFTDRTPEEFRQLLGFDKALGAHYNEIETPTLEFSTPRNDLPASVDWRQKGVVTPVKDQGQCGSCWTFATAETVESYWAIATGELMTLSEQQVASCTANPLKCGGSGGCGGGILQLAFESIIKHGGLASEWTYPYISYQGNNYGCMFHNRTTRPVAHLKGFQKLPSNENTPVLNAIQNGPLGISVDASAWHSYESGVFNGCNQVNPDIDHAVVLEGYGTDSTTGEDYWLVRNSWSPTWGEKGYIRILRQETPPCGLDITPLEGTGCVGGRSNVTACGTCGMLYSTTFPVVSV